MSPSHTTSPARIERRMAGPAPLLVAGVLFASAVGLLSGCGAAADKASEKLTETVAEQASGGDVDIDTDNGSVKIESGDDSISIGNGKVPDNWPEDLLPIPDDAQILMAISTADGQNLVLNTAESADDLAEQYTSSVTGAGYTEESRITTSTELGESTVVSWSGDGNYVTMSLAPIDTGETQATLSISPE